MIEGLPWPAWIGIAGTGWMLFGATLWRVVRGYQAGTTITEREAQAITRRAEKAEDALTKALDQNGQLMDMARLGYVTMQALNEAANQ